MSAMRVGFPRELHTLGEPLLQNGVFLHVQLERLTQANVRLDFRLRFLFKPCKVFGCQLCNE